MSTDGPTHLLTRDEAAEVVDICVRNDVADPERRSLLLGGIARSVAANLPTHTRPRDQLEADVNALVTLQAAEGMDEAPLRVWMANARRMIQSAIDAERMDAVLSALGPRVQRQERGRGDTQHAPSIGRRRRGHTAVLTLIAVGVTLALALALSQGGGPVTASENTKAATPGTPGPAASAIAAPAPPNPDAAAASPRAPEAIATGAPPSPPPVAAHPK